MIVLRGTDADKKIDYVFKLYDKDRSNCLTKDEIDAMLNALLAAKSAPGDRQQMIKEILAKMDANGDGKVTLQELTRVLKDARFIDQYIAKGVTSLNVADAALGKGQSRICLVM